MSFIHFSCCRAHGNQFIYLFIHTYIYRLAFYESEWFMLSAQWIICRITPQGEKRQRLISEKHTFHTWNRRRCVWCKWNDSIHFALMNNSDVFSLFMRWYCVCAVRRSVLMRVIRVAINHPWFEAIKIHHACHLATLKCSIKMNWKVILKEIHYWFQAWFANFFPNSLRVTVMRPKLNDQQKH
jgi:hypothetical protein